MISIVGKSGYFWLGIGLLIIYFALVDVGCNLIYKKLKRRKLDKYGIYICPAFFLILFLIIFLVYISNINELIATYKEPEYNIEEEIKDLQSKHNIIEYKVVEDKEYIELVRNRIADKYIYIYHCKEENKK